MIVRLLFIARRRWPILVVVPLLAAGVGYLFSPRGAAVVERTYESAALITINQDAIPSAVTVQQRLLEAEKGEVALDVAREIGDVSASDVDGHIDTSFDEESFTITVTGGGDSATEAEGYASAFASAFVERYNATATDEQDTALLDAQQRVDAAVDARNDFLVQNEAPLALPNPPQALQIQADALEQEVTEAEAALTTVQSQQTPTDQFTLVSVDPGSLSTADKLQLPASRALRISLGFLFGLVGALVLIAIVEKLNPRIDDPQHATDIVGAPVLAMVPVMGRRKHRRDVLQRADPADFRGPFAESYRSARTHLDFRATADGMERPPRIMITSATPAEGKSTTAAFLALAFAEAGRPPVLVGGDLRRPSVHELFEVPRAPGLSSRATMGGDAVPLSEIVATDPTTRVSVVPAGPAVDRVTGLLGDLAAVTGAAREAGRVTLVDTAPVMIANDAVDFLVTVDWVIVVIRVGRSTERAVRQMMQSLALNNANVVGVVMVGSLESADAKRYYYSYYSDDDSDLSRPRRVAAPSSSDGSPTPTTGTIDEVAPATTP